MATLERRHYNIIASTLAQTLKRRNVPEPEAFIKTFSQVLSRYTTDNYNAEGFEEKVRTEFADA